MTFTVGSSVRLTPEAYARSASKYFPDEPMTVIEVHPHAPTEPVTFWGIAGWASAIPEPQEMLTLYVVETKSGIRHHFLQFWLRPV